MYKEYEPNPLVVSRACRIWSDSLAKPNYDNGDRSFTGAMTRSLAEALPSNATPELLAAFRVELGNLLLAKWRYDSPSRTFVESEDGQYQSSLDVDYGPDLLLGMAAERVGLKMEFPWKSNMRLSEEHLCCSFGYGKPYQYHYPLDDAGSRWLVTTLYGSSDEIAKLVKSVNDGNPLDLRVDA